MKHKSGGVKTLHRIDIAGLGVDGGFTVWDDCGMLRQSGMKVSHYDRCQKSQLLAPRQRKKCRLEASVHATEVSQRTVPWVTLERWLLGLWRVAERSIYSGSMDDLQMSVCQTSSVQAPRPDQASL